MKEHLKILKALEELPFSLYEKDFIIYLKGGESYIINSKLLNENKSYGSLYRLHISEIKELLDFCKNVSLVIKDSEGKISLTAKGYQEIIEKKFSYDFKKRNYISELDKKIFKNFNFFLNKFNDEQKKAIISDKKNILCIAGPGTGKTTVLTKKIEFFVKFKSFNPKNILSITFTKKARKEMEDRLNKLGIKTNVETFNSFSEKLLKKNKKGKVISYKEKKELVIKAIEELDFDYDLFNEYYFKISQRRIKSQSELFFQFIYDTFSNLDFIKNTKIGFVPFYEKLVNIEKDLGRKYYDLLIKIDELMKGKDLRDFSDQIIELIDLFKENKSLIPKYDFILVDEFQDVNEVQYDLLKLLDSKRMFVVGDPRQAIFSWRGATDLFINNFSKYFRDPEIIYLFENYRSKKNIVEVSNLIIKDLMLPDLESNVKEKGKVFLKEFKSLEEEVSYIIDKIGDVIDRNEVFILARTNRILDRISEILKRKSVKHYIKKDIDDTKNFEKNEIILSTIHSIKGLEAKNVFLVDVNNINFPNRVKDNFIQEALKESFKYDKDKEELRLLYVGITRAKENLYILYTGVKSKFLVDEIKLYIEKENSFKDFKEFNDSTIQRNMLKDLRKKVSDILGVRTTDILDNNEIEIIVRIKPQTKEDLESLNIKNRFIVDKFSDDILDIFN